MVQNKKFMNEKKQVIVPIEKIYSKPNKISELESEALFGEIYNVKNKVQNWIKISNDLGDSNGWICCKSLSNVNEYTHKLKTLITVVKSEPNIKSTDISILTFNSNINVIDFHEDWAMFYVTSNDKIQPGYIPKSSLKMKSFKTNEFAKIARMFINIPYKWGGRSIFGIDCSALIQLILQFSTNKAFPRNSSKQKKILQKFEIDLNCLQKNDLVFWKGHVGIMSNKTHIIHANSHHMSVQEEPLTNAIDRIRGKYKLNPSFYKLNI